MVTFVAMMTVAAVLFVIIVVSFTWLFAVILTWCLTRRCVFGFAHNKLVELATVKPYAPARGAVVDLDALSFSYCESGVVYGALHEGIFAHLTEKTLNLSVTDKILTEVARGSRYHERMDKQEVYNQPGRPGSEHAMERKPEYIKESYKGSEKLAGKVALITGGDSGIGRAVAILFAREGANIVLSYLKEHKDAEDTAELVRAEGAECRMYAGDIGDEHWCRQLVDNALEEFGKIDILVNNAGEQHPQEDVLDITTDQWRRTFKTDIDAMFYLVREALPHLKKGSSIINTTSVTAYKGHEMLLDYSTTKGAIVSFTRSLSMMLAQKGIRVNAVAPGPIWTPLIPSTFPPEKVEKFGKDVPLGRPGEPSEVAPAFVLLASSDGSYITGQTIHVNGGTVVNG